MIEFHMVTQVKKHVSSTPPSQGEGPSIHKIFEGPLPTPIWCDLEWRNLVWLHMCREACY